MLEQLEANDTQTKPIFANQKKIAELFGLTESWLERDRWSGESGLPFYKLGRKVLYNVTEVETWLQQRRQQSTTQ
jgi:hypothetical protein